MIQSLQDGENIPNQISCTKSKEIAFKRLLGSVQLFNDTGGNDRNEDLMMPGEIDAEAP